MSPYGADDPATQSVQATHRFEAGAGRQIDAGVVALVQAGELRSAAAQARVGQVAAQLRGEPDVAHVVSYYDTRDPAMVSRDGRSTYVVGVTLIVLFLLPGSVVLPVKAVLMNALTLRAVFGILVLMFQHGSLEGLLGYRGQGALDATQPILLFAVAFGLSTDYGVFLLSRIKEARDAGLPNSDAVAVGLERTGRIVTAAALLFAVAIGAFATSKIVFIKELGIGSALAVLIDASIVRALLVPSLMALLGAANWWAPRPLRRLYERFSSGPPTAISASGAPAASVATSSR